MPDRTADGVTAGFILIWVAMLAGVPLVFFFGMLQRWFTLGSAPAPSDMAAGRATMIAALAAFTALAVLGIVLGRRGRRSPKSVAAYGIALVAGLLVMGGVIGAAFDGNRGPEPQDPPPPVGCFGEGDTGPACKGG